MIERILSSAKRMMSMMLVLVMLFALIPSLGLEVSAATTMEIPAETGFQSRTSCAPFLYYT